ncbi:MAG: xanthine dehydrogenase family protein subunit M [Vulcanimicrobiota bacterium]
MIIQEFYRPATISEAVALRKRYPSSVYLAGGTEINSSGWCMRRSGAAEVDRAVGIAHLPMGSIDITDSGIAIGANVIIQELIDNPDSPPLLAEAACQFANRNIRNMATIGGNIGANKSCSNLIPSLLALDARINLATEAGETSLSLMEYIAKPDPSALILSIAITRERINGLWATCRHSRTAHDISIISVAVTMFGNFSRVEKPVVSVGGVAATVIRLSLLEKQLDGVSLPSRDEIEAMVKPLISPIDDLRGSGAFKRQVAGALLSRALHQAAAGEGGKA